MANLEGKNRVFQLLRKGFSAGVDIFIRSLSPLVIVGSLVFLGATSLVRLFIQGLLVRGQRVFGFPLEIAEWWANCPVGASCLEIYWPGLFLDLVFSTTVCAALFSMIYWGKKDSERKAAAKEELKMITGWMTHPLGKKFSKRDSVIRKIAQKKRDSDSLPSGPNQSKN